MISRLGVLGGMFDPVHIGHVAAAEFAANYLQLERVKMIPCNQPNHKGQAHASASHRVAMLECATKNSAQLEIDDCEIQRGGVSYAVDTLRYLKEQQLAEHIVFVLGMDSFNSIPQWYEWEALFTLTHFLVLARNGEEVNSQTASSIDLEKRFVQNAIELFEQEVGQVHISTEFNNPNSSTNVRDALNSNQPYCDSLDPAVLNYIRQNELYS